MHNISLYFLVLLFFRYPTAINRTVTMSGKSAGDSGCHGNGAAGFLPQESRGGDGIRPKLGEVSQVNETTAPAGETEVSGHIQV
jgi:hypothetical protein